MSTKRRRRKESDLNDSDDELLRTERIETELERTRYERAEIRGKQKALEKPEDDSFLSGWTFEEFEELRKAVLPEKSIEFLGLGVFIDDVIKMKPKERRKAVANLLNFWPPPVPDTAKIYMDGWDKGSRLIMETVKLASKAGSAPMVMVLSPNSGATSAGGSVRTVMGVVGVAEPIEFQVREAPEGTKAEFIRRQNPGLKGLVEAEVVLNVPQSAQSGTYKVTFEARGADNTSATAQYSLTVS